MSDNQPAVLEPSKDVKVVYITGHNYRADVLAAAAMGAFVVVLITLLFWSPPTGPVHDTLLVLIGTLVGIVKDVYGYEFGASQPDPTGDIKAQINELKKPKP